MDTDNLDMLLRISQYVKTCTRCNLCRSRTHTVAGEGNPRARLMCIGEGPGYHEDMEGRPFVGASGHLLDKILAVSGFSRGGMVAGGHQSPNSLTNRQQDPAQACEHQNPPQQAESLEQAGLWDTGNAFIANIVKCRPPQNRAPLPEELAACLPLLLKQIEIINPTIIVLLGSTALKGLISPDARITRMRGQWIEWQGHWVMPTYHPSALLRDPVLKRPVWEDFKQVIDKYRELVDPNHYSPYH